MATKSILKSINVKDAKTAHRLVGAMERAMSAPQRKEELPHKFVEANREDIRKMFGKG